MEERNGQLDESGHANNVMALSEEPLEGKVEEHQQPGGFLKASDIELERRQSDSEEQTSTSSSVARNEMDNENEASGSALSSLQAGLPDSPSSSTSSIPETKSPTRTPAAASSTAQDVLVAPTPSTSRHSLSPTSSPSRAGLTITTSPNSASRRSPIPQREDSPEPVRGQPLKGKYSPPPTPPARIFSSQTSLRRSDSSGILPINDNDRGEPVASRLEADGSSSPGAVALAGVSAMQDGSGDATQALLNSSAGSDDPEANAGPGDSTVPSHSSPISASSSASGSSSPPTASSADMKASSPDSKAAPSASSASTSKKTSRNGANTSNQNSRPARRVKVYMLSDSNWIDVGTGSCTYHQGIVRRKRRKVDASSSNPGTGSTGGVSIMGRAARKQAEEMYEELIDIEDLKAQAAKHGESGKTSSSALEELLEEDDEEAAWIEVLKESRWKTDQPASSSPVKKGKKRKRKQESPDSKGSAKKREQSAGVNGKSTKEDRSGDVDGQDEARSPSSSPSEEDDTTADADEEPYDKIWRIRLERPEHTGFGSGVDLEAYSARSGPEEGEEVIGRYRRQQDTLIVWKTSALSQDASGPDKGDNQGETELALSFAASSGCEQVWDFLKEIHQNWEMHLIQARMDQEDEEDDVDSGLYGLSQGISPSHLSSSSNGRQLGATSSLGLGIGGTSASASGTNHGSQAGPAQLLQDPTITNISELEKTVKMVGRTIVGREKLSNIIIRTDFLRKLVPVFREAEDLESTADLHQLCLLVHNILSLNDHAVWDYVLADDVYFDIISILEYDPEFPTMKAEYRAHLSDPTLFKEVVPIKDATTKLKIHQVYRMQYFKDVILPRALDDSAFSIINSFIYFHQVDIVNYLRDCDSFWKELFGYFPISAPPVGTLPSASPAMGPSAISNGVDTLEKDTASLETEILAASSDEKPQRDSAYSDKQRDSIAFLQQYCGMVKQLQPNLRTQTFRTLSSTGLLRVLEFSLARMNLLPGDALLHTATVEILMLLVDHDTSSIRAFVLKEHDNKKRTLMASLIDCFHKEIELGVKTQLAEAIRVLLLPSGELLATETALSRTKPDDPNADKFLQYFYENCVTTLLDPLAKGFSPSNDADSAPLVLSAAQIALYSHLCDLLCFFIAQHSFRSKFFILSSSVTSKIALLLSSDKVQSPKHIKLAALRYFRACLGRHDDFYNRYLVKQDIFGSILDLASRETIHNNLLSSACLEFFEFIRLNNMKLILNNLMDRFEPEMKALAEHFLVFQNCISRYQQNNEPPPDPPTSDSAHGADTTAVEPSSSAPGPHPHQRSMSPDEEVYFGRDDDDEEEDKVEPILADDEPVEGSRTEASTSDQAEEAKVFPTLKRSESASSISSYAGKEEDDGDGDLLRRKRQRTDSILPAKVDGVTDDGVKSEQPVKAGEDVKPLSPSDKPLPLEPVDRSLPVPPSATGRDPDDELARIQEKRKRAEHEEEEEDILAKKSKEKDAKKTGNVAANAAGKIKLLFKK